MTKYVVDKARSEFAKKHILVDIYFIENTLIETVQLDSYNIVGFAYPTHSFNAPEIVINFAKKSPRVKSLNTFIISTAGEKARVNDSSSGLLAKILRKKGFNVFYERQFIMPSNFMVKDDANKVNEKIAKVNAEIPNTINEITNKVSMEQKTSLISNIMAFLGRTEWIGLKFGVKIFYAADNCDLCGLCVNNCPNKNIVIGEKRVRFRRNCGLCMRCVYLCPGHCIKPYRMYKFISFDKWYENDALSITKITNSK